MFRRPQTSAESGGRIRKYRVGTNPTRNRSQWDAAEDLPGSLRGTHASSSPMPFCLPRPDRAGPRMPVPLPLASDLLPPLPFFLFSLFFHPPFLSHPLSRPFTISSSFIVDLGHHLTIVHCPPSNHRCRWLTRCLASLRASHALNLHQRASRPHHLCTSPSSIHQFHPASTRRRSLLLANCLHIPGHTYSFGPLFLLTCRAVSRSLHPYTLDNTF